MWKKREDITRILLLQLLLLQIVFFCFRATFSRFSCFTFFNRCTSYIHDSQSYNMHNTCISFLTWFFVKDFFIVTLHTPIYMVTVLLKTSWWAWTGTVFPKRVKWTVQSTIWPKISRCANGLEHYWILNLKKYLFLHCNICKLICKYVNFTNRGKKYKNSVIAIRY